MVWAVAQGTIQLAGMVGGHDLREARGLRGILRVAYKAPEAGSGADRTGRLTAAAGVTAGRAMACLTGDGLVPSLSPSGQNIGVAARADLPATVPERFFPLHVQGRGPEMPVHAEVIGNEDTAEHEEEGNPEREQPRHSDHGLGVAQPTAHDGLPEGGACVPKGMGPARLDSQVEIPQRE